MKRLILLFLPFVSICINAEELKFVTVLSSPVGTFNKLEAVNPAVPAKSPTINFCTSIGNGGTVTLQAKDATKHPTMNTVNMSSNTELGGNGGNYVLNRITMNKGGVLQGSRLLANTLQVGQSSAGKSENLYINNLTVAGAKAKSLDINNGESKISASHADPGMVWSNQYQTDNACKDGNGCAKQYLLKQKGGSTPSTCNQQLANACENDGAIDGVIGEWHEEVCECACPAGFVVTPEGYCGCPEGLQFIPTINGVTYGKCGQCDEEFVELLLDKTLYGDFYNELMGIVRYCKEYGPSSAEDWGGTWNSQTCSCDCSGLKSFRSSENPLYKACYRYEQGGYDQDLCDGMNCDPD